MGRLFAKLPKIVLSFMVGVYESTATMKTVAPTSKTTGKISFLFTSLALKKKQIAKAAAAIIQAEILPVRVMAIKKSRVKKMYMNYIG